jgi:hypothetical protein
VNGRPASATPSYKTEANDCNLPTSQYAMDVNNVRSNLLTAGDLWFNIATSSAAYEVPKGDRTSATAYPQAIYVGAIWMFRPSIRAITLKSQRLLIVRMAGPIISQVLWTITEQSLSLPVTFGTSISRFGRYQDQADSFTSYQTRANGTVSQSVYRR